jgi:hypothetical protein
VDIVLRNFVRNSTLIDSRRRAALPLFTGRRLPSTIGRVNGVAFDITSLLVLGWLGILVKALDTFPQIIIPAGAITELFEGRRRIRQAQRSRVQKAIEIRDAIANRQLKVLRTPTSGGKRSQQGSALNLQLCSEKRRRPMALFCVRPPSHVLEAPTMAMPICRPIVVAFATCTVCLRRLST